MQVHGGTAKARGTGMTTRLAKRLMPSTLRVLKQDNIIDVLEFLDLKDVGKFDIAVSNHKDRAEWFLPALATGRIGFLDCFFVDCRCCTSEVDREEHFDLLFNWVVIRGIKLTQIACPVPTWTGRKMCSELLKLSQPDMLLSLVFKGCTGVTYFTISSVCKTFSRLQDFDLGHTDVDAKTLRVILNKCVNLKRLDIQHCGSLTDRGFQLNADIRLEDLHLDNNPAWVRDTTLSRIAHMGKTLRVLSMSNCGLVTDAVLKHIQPLKKLSTLVLSGCSGLTSAGIGGLVLPNLRRLGLSRCDVQDEDLPRIVESSPLLQRLELGDCRDLSDSGVESLKELKDLKVVLLGHCTGLSEVGVSNLVYGSESIHRILFCSCDAFIVDEFIRLSWEHVRVRVFKGREEDLDRLEDEEAEAEEDDDDEEGEEGEGVEDEDEDEDED